MPTPPQTVSRPPHAAGLPPARRVLSEFGARPSRAPTSRNSSTRHRCPRGTRQCRHLACDLILRPLESPCNSFWAPVRSRSPNLRNAGQTSRETRRGGTYLLDCHTATQIPGHRSHTAGGRCQSSVRGPLQPAATLMMHAPMSMFFTRSGTGLRRHCAALPQVGPWRPAKSE